MEENNTNPSQPVSQDIQSTPATPPVSNIAKPKPKFSPTFIIGLILFLLVACSVAGFYVIKQRSLKTAVKPSPSLQSAEIPKGMKEYKNNVLGFSFQYPEKYEITNPPSSDNLLLEILNTEVPKPSPFDFNITPKPNITSTPTPTIPIQKNISVNISYYLDNYQNPNAPSFEELSKFKNSSSNTDGNLVTTTIEKKRINNYDTYISTNDTKRKANTEIDHQQTYYFQQNGYKILISVVTALDSPEISNFTNIINSIKFFKPTEPYTQPYDILNGLWEKGTTNYAGTNDVSFEYPKSFIATKNENDSGVTINSKGIIILMNLEEQQKLARTVGFDNYYFLLNQFRMEVNIIPNITRVTLADYLKDQFGKPYHPGGNPSISVDGPWKDFKVIDTPIKGSYVSKNSNGGNEEKSVYFLYKGNFYIFSTMATGNLGAILNPSAEALFDKIVQSIKLN